MTLAEIIAEAKRQSHNFGTIVLATEDALRLVAVAEAAVELRAKMRATYADPRYMNVWATAQERLGPYTGPNWIAEAEALDAALRGEGQKP